MNSPTSMPAPEQPEPASRPPADPGASSRRQGPLDVIAGDRPCAACGFNLHGQPITREPGSNLLFCRCPECGTAAALQEYPLLGRWAERLRFVVAALWLGLLLLGIGACVAAASACIEAGTAAGIETCSSAIMQRYTSYVESLSVEEQTKLGAQINNGRLVNIWNASFDETWWSGQSLEAILAERAVSASILQRTIIRVTLIALLTLLPFGVLLSVAMPHLRWRGRLLLVLLISACTAVVTYLSIIAQGAATYAVWYGPSSAWARIQEISFGSQFWRLLPAAAIIPLGLFVFGLFLGRPIARWLVTYLVPPRARVPFAFLWRADNIPMPRPGA